MRVIDHAEVSVRLLAGRRKGMDLRGFLIPDDLHVVAALITDPVGPDAVVVLGRGFQAREPYADDAVVQVGHTITAAEHFPAVGEVRFPADDDIAVGKVAHGEGHAHRLLRIILQHGRGHNQRSGGGFRLFL